MIKIKEDFKNLIPALTPEEFAQLEANCIADGIREPIMLYWAGEVVDPYAEEKETIDYIIDGHNRYAIAEKHKLEYQVEWLEFDSDDEVKEWMIKNQFGRRNLSNYQRSLLALALEDLYKTKAKQNQLRTKENRVRQISDEQTIDTKKVIGTLANVSHDTIAKVKVIEAKAAPEVKQKLSTGEVSINQVYQEIKKEEKKKVAEEKKEEIKLKAKDFNESNIQIENIDFRKLQISDNSIDLILTDPPYPAEFLPLWKDLFIMAKRILKPNKFLIAYSGQMYLDKIFQYANEVGLDYYWIMNIEFTKKPLIQGRNVLNEWKPILVFQNGLKKHKDVFSDKIAMSYTEREMHDLNWGQTVEPFEFLLDRFSHPNDLIFEPFAGTGTTLVACKNKKRRCIAAELEQKYIDLIKGRLA